MTTEPRPHEPNRADPAAGTAAAAGGHEAPVIDVQELRRVYGSRGRATARRTANGKQSASGVRRPGEKGEFEAVRSVSFSVGRGELFALLGTNGAGKTSTVELLEGLAAPAGGRVRILGHDPYTERSAVRPRTGVMLQEGGFPSDLTAAETVRMWAGCTSGARPVGEALDMVGLSGRDGVRVKQLSGGERRRLDLALALLGRPEVLFLDEPTTGLDPEGRRETWDLVRALRDEGTTVLLTTHYLEEAEELADRLAILHEGRIAAEGTVAEVVAAQPSMITFELPDGYLPGDLPPLAPLGVLHHELSGRTLRMQTHELQRTATEILLWARERNMTLGSLQVRSASLEEAFLRIAREESARNAKSVPSAHENDSEIAV